MRMRAIVAAATGVAMFLAGGLFLSAREGESRPARPSTSAARLLEVPYASGENLDQTIATLRESIRAGNRSPEAYSALAAGYLQKARTTGDSTYFAVAARALGEARAADPGHLTALLGSGQLGLAVHDFKGALAWGRSALEQDPQNPTAFGIVGDAQLELGRYDEAVDAFQRMVDLRPDLASFARISYARELYGDIPAAIEAMKRALRAGASVPENAVWASNQLGDLYFGDGRLAAAERRYRAALRAAPGFTDARLGIAEISVARGNLGKGLHTYRRIVRRFPAPDHASAYGDALTAAGRAREASRQYALVRSGMEQARASGVLADVEMVIFFADQGNDPQRALSLARRLYRERPGVHTADALAWALYRTGRIRAASSAIEEALSLGTRDAIDHFHAGMIAAAAGDSDEARRKLRIALEINPYFSVLQAPIARRMLRALGNQS